MGYECIIIVVVVVNIIVMIKINVKVLIKWRLYLNAENNRERFNLINLGWKH